jgi:hypothetical protein
MIWCSLILQNYKQGLDVQKYFCDNAVACMNKKA